MKCENPIRLREISPSLKPEIMDFSTSSERALVAASRRLTWKIVERPPCKKASKKGPLGARREPVLRLLLLPSRPPAPCVAPSFTSFYFFFCFFTPLPPLLHFLGVGFRCGWRIFEDSSRGKFAKSSPMHSPKYVLITSVNCTYRRKSALV